MIEELGEGAWILDSGRDGRRLALSFGVHGNERAPIDAGLRLVAEAREGKLELSTGSVLLVHANHRASAQDRRWSEGGVDLNRCFHPDVLGRPPELSEERRAREIVGWLESFGPEALVDFHCTVEPGERFMMHHPPIADAAHGEITGLLEADVVLADPTLTFGGVSLDEWMSTRGKVGICYETGWMGDPANTPESVYGEMVNVLAGCGLLSGEARTYPEKNAIELYSRIVCDGEGFVWSDGTGQNLQELPAGTTLGRYGDGREVALEADSTLIFPKKRPELVEQGKPLVLLARKAG